ncbi:hypothetical protein NW754_002314 [Fusarium falciforme]|nr:hypothetical protein NW754_002314 [Fusarium falciforme]
MAADSDDQDDDEERVDQAINEALDGEMEDDEDEEIQPDVAVSSPDENFTSSHPAPEEINSTTFREYSQNGAPGMLHNIGLQLRASPQLYEQFLQSQRKEFGKELTLHWVFNNATRWDSDMRMMERALRLRPALNTFFRVSSQITMIMMIIPPRGTFPIRPYRCVTYSLHVLPRVAYCPYANQV